MPKTKGNSSIGVNYGKRDMERIGLFAESGWLHGVPYISPHSCEYNLVRNNPLSCEDKCCTFLSHVEQLLEPISDEFRDGATKGRQMLSEGGKTKTGLQDCYFERGPYKRIFEKEAYSSAVRENYLASYVVYQKNLTTKG